MCLIFTQDNTANMVLLTELNIAECIGASYKEIGILLLGDEYGTIVGNIEHSCQYRATATSHGVLHYWVNSGRDRTWRKLVTVLREKRFIDPADKLEEALCSKCSKQ